MLRMLVHTFAPACIDAHMQGVHVKHTRSNAELCSPPADSLHCCCCCRCCLAVGSAMYDPHVNVRGLMQYFAPFYMACNVLLLVLCIMQWVWFSAVLR